MEAVTAAVHAKGGHIFAQFMHTGRVGHPLNLPEGAELVAPSAIAAPGEMYTDQKGMQPHPTPRAMTEADIARPATSSCTREERHRAGFDGVEIPRRQRLSARAVHQPGTNHRTDAYGGSIEKRARFVLEVARAVADAIGGPRSASASRPTA